MFRSVRTVTILFLLALSVTSAYTATYKIKTTAGFLSQTWIINPQGRRSEWTIGGQGEAWRQKIIGELESALSGR